jgi:ADP-ribosyl-[dinitrogen reductase] hydrolase
MNQTQQARAHGVLLGQACGDALGVPYEFGSARLPATAEPRMIGGGLGPYEPGEWSDDTQMAIMVAQALLIPGSSQPAMLDALAGYFLDWESAGATDIGVQTRAVLRRVQQARLGQAVSGLSDVMLTAAEAHHVITGRSAGNGSLMRTAPVALRYLNDRQATANAAIAISKLTHYDDLAAEACVIWCELIRVAVLTGTLDGLSQCLELLPEGRRSFWRQAIEDAFRFHPDHFANNGYVVSAFQAALSSIWGPWSAGSSMTASEKFRQSLVNAVHAGGDTDTVAAITGALAGALYGSQAIPAGWLSSIHGWPGLVAEDLVNLADGLTR